MLKLIAKSPLGVALAAGVAATALVTSVVTFATDTVEVRDILFSSDPYAGVEGGTQLNLEIANQHNNSGCAQVSYQDDDILSFDSQLLFLQNQTIDLTDAINNGFDAEVSFGGYCIRNNSGHEITGQLSATLLARSSAEVGSCSSVELRAESPRTASCGDGDDGELDQVLQITIMEGDLRCSQLHPVEKFSATFLPSDPIGTTVDFTVGSLNLYLVDGAECIIHMTMSVSGSATDNTLLRTALTDTLRFDIALNLADPS